MKSLRESLSLWGVRGPTPSLGPMPKSGVGVLPHKEEQLLQKLWSDMLKAEEGCRQADGAVQSVCDEVVAVQQKEEKLLCRLLDLHSSLTLPHLNTCINALNSLLPQVGKRVPEWCEAVQGRVGGPVSEYHALYGQVDVLRTKRDALIADINKINDKMEKLRLKGRRSTDCLVERERVLKQAQEVQAQLLQEAASYHALRTDYLQQAVYSFVDTQFLQYGGEAELYMQHVVGGAAHQPNLGRLNDSTAQHLATLEALSITGAQGDCPSAPSLSRHSVA